MGSKVLNVCALWCYAVIIMINFNGTNGNELSNSVNGTNGNVPEISNNIILDAIIKLEASLDNIKSQISDMKSQTSDMKSQISDMKSQIECPESAGYFMAPETEQSQCLKVILEELTWTEARDKCRAEGLVLARPFNAVALRKYIFERYGGTQNSWIDGRANGSEFMWQENRDGDEKVGSYNPLWFPGSPGDRISSEHCLLMLTNTGNTKANPDQPYFANSCSGTTHAVCEKLM